MSSARELIAELSMGFQERQTIERNRAEKNNDYHRRSGCGWACGRRVFTVTFFFKMVSNGVDADTICVQHFDVEVMEIETSVYVSVSVWVYLYVQICICMCTKS